MAESAKNESYIGQSGQTEASNSLQHIYSALAKARRAGESEYAPKSEEDQLDITTSANDQHHLSDNTGSRLNSAGQSQLGPTAEKEQNVSNRLIAISQGQNIKPLHQVATTSTKAKQRIERREALKLQGQGRRRRDKENLGQASQDNDSGSENDGDKTKKRKNKNVLTRMEEAATGPMSLLYRSVKERLKVKVWTRSFNSVRGICTGYILAFDTHFNMVMADVDEVYKPIACSNTNLNQKVKKKRRKKVIKESPAQNSDICTTVTPMDTVGEDQVSQQLLAPTAQVDGMADSSESELDVVSAASADSDDNGDGNNSPKSAEGCQQPCPGKDDLGVAEESSGEDDDGEEEEESEESAEEEEDLQELMFRLNKLKNQYAVLKTIETPEKSSHNEPIPEQEFPSTSKEDPQELDFRSASPMKEDHVERPVSSDRIEILPGGPGENNRNTSGDASEAHEERTENYDSHSKSPTTVEDLGQQEKRTTFASSSPSPKTEAVTQHKDGTALARGVEKQDEPMEIISSTTLDVHGGPTQGCASSIPKSESVSIPGNSNSDNTSEKETEKQEDPMETDTNPTATPRTFDDPNNTSQSDTLSRTKSNIVSNQMDLCLEEEKDISAPERKSPTTDKRLSEDEQYTVHEAMVEDSTQSPDIPLTANKSVENSLEIEKPPSVGPTVTVSVNSLEDDTRSSVTKTNEASTPQRTVQGKVEGDASSSAKFMTKHKQDTESMESSLQETVKEQTTSPLHLHKASRSSIKIPSKTSSLSPQPKNKESIDKDKTARLETMIANLKVEGPEQKAKEPEETSYVDLRSKLKVIREAKEKRSSESESSTRSSRQVKSHVVQVERPGRSTRLRESEAASEEHNRRSCHSSERESESEERQRRNLKLDTERTRDRRDSRDRDRYTESDRYRDHDMKKEHGRKKEYERSKDYEHSKEYERYRYEKEMQSERERKEYERRKEYDRQKEHSKQKESERPKDRERHKERKGQRDYDKQEEYERHKDYKQQRGSKISKEEKFSEQERRSYSDQHKPDLRSSDRQTRNKPKQSISEERCSEQMSTRTERELQYQTAAESKSSRYQCASDKRQAEKASASGKHRDSDRSSRMETLRSQTEELTKDSAKSSACTKPKWHVKDRIEPLTSGRKSPSILEKLMGTPIGNAGLYQRHLKQTMIRGDNVVMVSIVP